MKTIKLSAIAISLLFMTNNIKAQATASATAEGTIVSPIAFVNVQALEFGNLAVSTTAGTVEVNSATGARTTTGGVTLPSTTGTFHEAIFNVSGEPNYTYNVSGFGAILFLTHTNATDFIIGSLTGSVSNSGTYTLDGTGNDVVHVGGSLNISGSQLPGFYTNATAFTLTVNYN